jgi:sec-independent protein translocase protein TatC
MNLPNDDDLFSETRMSFGDHLEELRTCMVRALLGLLVGVVLSFFFGGYIVALIKTPVEDALLDYYIDHLKKHATERNKLLSRFMQELQKDEPEEVLKLVNEPKSIPITLSAQELDQQFRRLYPKLFERVDPPPADAPPITLQASVRPLDVVTQLESAFALLIKRTTLSTLSAPEMFFVYFKVCLLSGIVLSCPWVFYQIWRFVAAGLYPNEKRYVYASLAPAIFLFLSGVLLCQFVIIPKALGALLEFNLMLNVEPDFRLNEWLSFAILMPVVTGLCFQTPLVMFVLAKIGMFTAADYSAKRRMAIFIMLIFTAFITPTIDIPSLMLVWLPMVVLYEVGIWVVRWQVKPALLDDVNEVPYQPSVDGYSGR